MDTVKIGTGWTGRRAARVGTLLATVLLGLAFEAAAQETEPFEGAMSIAPDASIRVYLEAGGSVRIVGWQHDSLQVSGTRTAGVGRIGFGGDESSAKVGYWPEKGSNASEGTADIVVHVPARATVWVKLTTASVDITGVTGGLDVYTIKGDVRVSGNPSDLSAESMGGRIDLAGTAPTVKAKTGSGPITFRGESDNVTLVTVSGSITVIGPRLKWGYFESVKGDIVFQGELAKGSSIKFKNHSGDVELRLPERVGAEFSVTTWEGELSSEFAVDTATVDERKGGKIRTFTVGKGYASVEIQNFGGKVILRKQ
jgi:hypothetical protein